MSMSRAVAALAGAASLVLFLSGSNAATAAKGPPACSAIHFRPIAPGMADGVETAGLYRSRFIGLLEVKANVKGGQPESYYVTVNDKPLGEARSLPKSAASCASSKHLPAPGAPAGACTGDRLTVLIDHGGDKRYVLLYARQGASWQFCSAGAS